MKRDGVDFVSKFLTYQQVRAEHQLSSDLLNPLSILNWNLEYVTCHFAFGLPKSLTKNDYICVVVD